jgi:hypothetical protein
MGQGPPDLTDASLLFWHPQKSKTRLVSAITLRNDEWSPYHDYTVGIAINANGSFPDNWRIRIGGHHYYWWQCHWDVRMEIATLCKDLMEAEEEEDNDRMPPFAFVDRFFEIIGGER